MKFEVPQFIDIEDKIFGPLTWRQFVYLGGGGGAVVVLFLTMPLLVTVIFGVPLALIAGALAFYPVHNRPFSHFLEAVYNFMTNKRLYLFEHKPDIVYKQPTVPKKTTKIKPQNRGTTHKNITSLTRSLELQALQKPEA